MITNDLTNFKYVTNFQYVAVLVMVMMLIYLMIEKLLFLKRSRLFFVVIILSIISTVFDITRAIYINRAIEVFDSNRVIYTGLITSSNVLVTFYSLTLSVALLAFLLYLTDITCGLDYMHSNKLRFILFYFPTITMFGILFANFFTCTFFRYEFTNKLVMNVNLITLGIIGGLLSAQFIYSVILILKFRNLFERKQIYAMLLVPLLLFAGIVAEIITRRQLLLSFIISITIVLILTINEASEDVMDLDTKLYNNSEFIKTIRKVFITKSKTVCVLIRINNYSELLKTYDLTEVNNYNVDVSSKVKRIKKEQKVSFEIFSLKNGYYATVFDEKLINILGSGLLSGLDSDKYCTEFIPDYSGCLINFIKDFENVDEVINFVNNFRSTIKFKDEFTIYSTVKNDKNLIIANHLESIIDTALQEGEFCVYYQPIYSIKDQKYKTAEALVRLISKKYGFISPGSFIPYAENTGRIEEIDSFVMEEVFKFASSATFEALGLEYIEINLSMAECVNPNLIERIKTLMEKYNLDPKRINLEITESFDVSEQDLINQNLHKLHEMGFNFALDDYGTGYSNINRFSTLPISIVKIDKSLVDESEDKNIKKILDYSFNIVKDLDKQTVVEGVETKEQLDRFTEYGATYIQGFYFSKPLDFDSYVNFVRENNR